MHTNSNRLVLCKALRWNFVIVVVLEKLGEIA